MMQRIILLFSLCSAFILAEEVILYHKDFKDGLGEWKVWSDNVDVEAIRSEHDGIPVMELKGGGSWLTPIAYLPKPVKCRKNTMLRFKLWSDTSMRCEINIDDFDEAGASYSRAFSLTAMQWTTVQCYPAMAEYKFKGRSDVPKDGLLNDHISQIQICTRGKKVLLEYVELVDVEENTPELPSSIRPPLTTEKLDELIRNHVQEHPLADYTLFKRNGIFPFAVVTRLDANKSKSAQFGEDLEESKRRDLLDMRRHYINAYYDFCISGDDQDMRLRRSEDIGIKLIETCFSGTLLTGNNASHSEIIKKCAASPAFLAWYGKDEPTEEQIIPFVKSKLAANTMDSRHPYLSAMHMDYVRKHVGPAMEVLLADIYNIFNEPSDAVNATIFGHMQATKVLRSYSGGGHVWFMTQTFSNRHPSSTKVAAISARYATPEEIRLDMYSILAGGAHGISFFIYNDHVPFLGGSRGEKFDYTLVDPWGNGNATYDELADFGKRIVPIMSSILDSIPSEQLQIKTDNDDFAFSQFQNSLGHYLIIVNKNTKKASTGKFTVSLPEGMKLYSLTKQAALEADAPITIGPAYGEILAIVNPETFAMLDKEISDRILKQKEELIALRQSELAKAGFADGNASRQWLEAETKLQNIRERFGSIYQELVKPSRILYVDSTPEFESENQQICALSKQYFKLKQEHANGLIPEKDVLDKLVTDIDVLKAQYMKKLAEVK